MSRQAGNRFPPVDVLLGDVEPARVADLGVDDGDLAVVAVVDLRDAGHVEPDDGARVAQPLRDEGVRWGDVALEAPGAARRGHVLRVDVVLEKDGDAVERARGAGLPELCVQCGGLLQGRVPGVQQLEQFFRLHGGQGLAFAAAVYKLQQGVVQGVAGHEAPLLPIKNLVAAGRVQRFQQFFPGGGKKFGLAGAIFRVRLLCDIVLCARVFCVVAACVPGNAPVRVGLGKGCKVCHEPFIQGGEVFFRGKAWAKVRRQVQGKGGKPRITSRS